MEEAIALTIASVMHELFVTRVFEKFLTFFTSLIPF